MTVNTPALKIKMKDENENMHPLQPLTQNIQNKWITKPINLRSFCATQQFFCQKINECKCTCTKNENENLK